MSERAVLCVDDEVHILSSLVRLLRKESYDLVTAGSGEAGLAVLKKRPVQLVVSDQRMPGMTGIEFLQAVKQRHADTVRVVLSGYADISVIVDSINKGEIYRFLTKPWNDEELKTAFRQCLEHHDIVQQNRSLVQQIRRQNNELRRLNEALELNIESRTKSLQFSQEILDRLPVSVVCISREGIMVLANRLVRESFPSLRRMSPGTDMRQIFPSDITDTIALRLGGEAPPDPPEFELDQQRVRIHVEPLRSSDSLRGCILILQASKDE